MHTLLLSFWNDEQGQDMVEYALILAFVAMAGIAGYNTIHGDLVAIWGATATQTTLARGAATT